MRTCFWLPYRTFSCRAAALKPTARSDVTIECFVPIRLVSVVLHNAFSLYDVPVLKLFHGLRGLGSTWRLTISEDVVVETRCIPSLVAAFTRCVQDPCSQPPEPGWCLQNMVMFYYDPDRGSCNEFTYTGCGRNFNNFLTKQECRKICIEGTSEQCTCLCGLPLSACRQSVDESRDVCRLRTTLQKFCTL